VSEKGVGRPWMSATQAPEEEVNDPGQGKVSKQEIGEGKKESRALPDKIRVGHQKLG